MNLWRKLVIGCIGIPFVILIGLLLFAEWAWGGSIKPSLDSQYIPTAEYLLQHVQPTPAFISVYPEPGTLLTKDSGIYVAVEKDNNTVNISEWTRLYINNQRIARDSYGVVTSTGSCCLKDGKVDPIVFQFNMNNRLTSGIHLFHIQLASSFNDFLNPDPKLSYEWAYRVE